MFAWTSAGRRVNRVLAADASRADATDLGTLLATAAEFRVRGDRPCPAPLAAGVDRLRAQLGTGTAIAADAAADLAVRLLAGITGG